MHQTKVLKQNSLCVYVSELLLCLCLQLLEVKGQLLAQDSKSPQVVSFSVVPTHQALVTTEN